MIMRYSCCVCRKEFDVELSEEEYNEEDFLMSDSRLIEKALDPMHKEGWDYILGRCYCPDHMEIGEKALADHLTKEDEKAA